MKKILLTVLLVAPFFSMASGTTIEWRGDTDYINGASSSAVNTHTYVDTATNTKMTLTGWSYYDSSWNRSEKMGKWGSVIGIDNGRSSEHNKHEHGADNSQGYDFFLMSFSDNTTGNDVDVEFEGAWSGWSNTSSGLKMKAARLEQNGSGSLSIKEWFDLSSTAPSTSTSYYSVGNDKDAGESAFWLVGLGFTNHLQSFKFLGAKGNIGPAVDVSEPGALALFALGLAFMARRKQVS